MSKTVAFKMPTPAATPADAEDWIGRGVEPHLRKPVNEAESAPVAMKRFTIDVTADLHSRIKVACAQRGVIMADEIRRLLEAEFPAVAKS